MITEEFVERAKSIVMTLFKDQEIFRMRLEELDFDYDNDRYVITISYERLEGEEEFITPVRIYKQLTLEEEGTRLLSIKEVGP